MNVSKNCILFCVEKKENKFEVNRQNVYDTEKFLEKLEIRFDKLKYFNGNNELDCFIILNPSSSIIKSIKFNILNKYKQNIYIEKDSNGLIYYHDRFGEIFKAGKLIEKKYNEEFNRYFYINDRYYTF